MPLDDFWSQYPTSALLNLHLPTRLYYKNAYSQLKKGPKVEWSHGGDKTLALGDNVRVPPIYFRYHSLLTLAPLPTANRGTGSGSASRKPPKDLRSRESRPETLSSELKKPDNPLSEEDGTKTKATTRQAFVSFKLHTRAKCSEMEPKESQTGP